jgi:hypothetical protein
LKSKEETLFDHYQLDENGAPVLEDSDIFDAMQEYAEQMLTEYILEKTGCKSKFEAKREKNRFLKTIKP